MSDEAGDEPIPPDVIEAARRLPLPHVPPEVSRDLRKTFDRPLPTIPADLVADTREGSPLVGVRGGASAAWTMSYEAGTCDVVLDLVPRRSTVRLTGQLLCSDGVGGVVVQCYQGDELATVGSTDDHGQFDLGDLDRAEYTIAAARASEVIEIVVDLREP